MSLRYAVLGLLAEQPMSGYELTRHFDEAVAGAWSARHSQIYPELARLLDDRLIRVVEEGPRGRKRYATTPEGVAEVRAWLTETEPDHTARSDPYIRVFLLWLVEPAQAVAYLETLAERHQENLTRFTDQAFAIDPDSPAAAFTRVGLEAGIRHEEALLAWARWAVDEVRRLPARPQKRRRATAAPATRTAARS